ncbi:MAG: tRNA (adenosine(37)-N6)-dimethylallyltransferase MiaA [Methyloceanibacter sp.]
MALKAGRPKAILIAGPTASGKSAAALDLAQRLGGAVINADSMQVYRELAILTAQPSPAEMQLAPHRLYGTVPASEPYSAGRFVEDAARALRNAAGEGSVPIFVGGTGLYFKVLTEGLAAVPDVPPEIRAHWRAEAEKIGTAGLYRELQARDPVMAARLRPSDPQRILRALEVIDATSISLAEWQGGDAAPLLEPGAVLRIVIAPEREALYAGIDARFDRMIARGAVEEVRALLTQGLDPGLPAMRAHGVRELAVYLSGGSSLAASVEKSKTESRRYAKRQMTWLRRFMQDWDWFPDAAAAVENSSP